MICVGPGPPIVLATILDQVFRRDGGTVLAGLIRFTGEFDLAEDALQDAMAKALVVWPRDGLPENPAGWLAVAARRQAVDRIRRRRTTEVLPEIAVEPEEIVEPFTIADDRLRLVFTCCHPAIALPAQVALALRTLGGLTTREIARAFLEPEATTAQRLVRVKQKIRDAKIPYIVPEAEDLPERLIGVLGVVYFIFNEAYAATDSPSLVRLDLAAEAIRLGRLVVELMPNEPEARGLLALLLVHHSRRDTRVNEAGELVPLEEQDRSRWDQAEITEGLAKLEEALKFRRPGPYQIQAAVGCLHAQAKTPEATDWPQIAALYGSLLRHLPTPVVELNAAVALALAGNFASGLDWIESLERRPDLAVYHLVAAAKADLLRRTGRTAEAAMSYRQALAIVRNPAERLYLVRRLREVES